MFVNKHGKGNTRKRALFVMLVNKHDKKQKSPVESLYKTISAGDGT